MRVKVLLILTVFTVGFVDAARRRRVRSTTITSATTMTTPVSFIGRQLGFAEQPEELESLSLWDNYDIQKLDNRADSWKNSSNGTEKDNKIVLNLARQYPGLPANPGETNELPNPIPPQPVPPPQHLPPGCLGPRGQYQCPKSCANYFNCWDDVVVEQTCPNGLLFNDVTNVCDYDYNVNCGDRPLPTPKPPLSPASNHCPDPNGRYRSSTNCSEFYVCVRSKPVKFCCPRGLAYNDILGVCDYPYNIDCKGAATPKPQPAHPPTQPPQTPTNPPLTRPSKPSTYPPQPTYPSQRPTYPSQPPAYPSQPPTYPSQSPAYPSQPPTYPSHPPTQPPQTPTNPPPTRPSKPSTYPPQPTYPSQRPTYPSQPPAYPSQPPAYPSQPPTYPSQSPAYPSQPPTYPTPQPPAYPPQPHPSSPFPIYGVGNPWLTKDNPNPWHQRPTASQLDVDIERSNQEELLNVQPLANKPQSVTETSTLVNPWNHFQTMPPELMNVPCTNGDVHRLNEACTNMVVCRNERPQLVRCSLGFSYDKPTDSCKPFSTAKC